MKKLIIIFLSLFCYTSIWAQNSIKGRVLQQDHTPLDYAEVQLIQNDDKLIKQSFSSETGTFSLENIAKGKYILKVLYLGEVLNSQPIDLNQDLVLKDILIESNKQLEEIVLKSEKKLIERKVDRLVFNTANSISSQGMDAIETLANTPMIKVQNDKISIVGKSSVTIMINEKIVHLSGEALANYLKTLRSDDIEKIEVITTPPAKYEASGNSGLINIVLKKNRRQGLYGSIGSSFSYNNKRNIGANGNINYQKNKWNLSLKANNYDGRNKNKNGYSYTGVTNGLENNGELTGKYKQKSVDFTVNYQVTDLALIGASYNYTSSKNDYTKYSQIEYFTVPRVMNDSVLTSLNYTDNPTSYHTLNVFYDQKLDTLGNKLAFGVNYFNNSPDNTNYINDYNATNAILNQLINQSALNYNVWSANIDLNYDLKWINLETGAKYTNFDNKSKVYFYTFENEQKVYDPTKSNKFNYSEDNYAAYLSLSKKLSDKWEVKAGMRFEQTKIEGKLQNDNSQFTKSYNKWFPTAYLTYTPSDDHALSFNYSKRINRPNSSILNPFKYYGNTYSYTTGNPNLAPSFTDNYELSYIFNGALSLTLNYYHVSNSFDVLSVFENGYFTESWYNMLNSDNYGFDISYSNKILPWWETNTGADYYFSSPYYSKDSTLKGMQGSTFAYYSQNTFNINEAKTVKVFLNWYHMLPNKEDNSRYNAYKTLSTGMKLNLLDKKLNLNLTLSDIFNTGKSSGTMYYTDNTQTFYNEWSSRRVSISATYNFGNNKNKKVIQEANFEDKSRSQ
ncbi:TonB-dependent receptor family protein [Myroides albus]|uniref:TonB-dependent receptor n=1 Tax=Myroides albus TaxID=2562892 RepID=A0A6I3LG91_9FLAO|nr:outer membrane beta-barrel family protein [Myroides albus]MTG96907.1 TonB-dependent receptor [Myroides albus]UVD78343.1 TonB-dependent receptor family protein [Myroides albus]